MSLSGWQQIADVLSVAADVALLFCGFQGGVSSALAERGVVRHLFSAFVTVVPDAKRQALVRGRDQVTADLDLQARRARSRAWWFLLAGIVLKVAAAAARSGAAQ